MDPVTRKLAMKVSSNRLIWPTDTPNRAGIISVRTLTTPGSCHPHFGFTKSPARYRKGNWKASCTIPPKNTPHASAKAGCDMCGDNNQAQAMIHTFSNTGVNDATANLFRVLRMAPDNPVNEINAIYGKVILSMVLASSNFAPSGSSFR